MREEPTREVYVMGDFNESFEHKEAKSVYKPWLGKSYHLPSQYHVDKGEYSYISYRGGKPMLDHIVAGSVSRIES